MTSSADEAIPGKIIRGAKIDGVVLCSPSGKVQGVEKDEEEQNLKALEEFWHHRGYQSGKEKGFEEGHKLGEQEGHRKGHLEGKDQGLKEGKSAGLIEGEESGREKAKESFSSAVSMLNELADKFSQTIDQLFEQAKPEVLRFCKSACEKILEKELSQEEEMMNLVARLLSRAKGFARDKPVDVILASAQFECLSQKLETFLTEQGLDMKINLVSDSTLPVGHCQINTSMGMLNFNIRRQLDDIERRAMEVREDETEVIDDEPSSGLIIEDDPLPEAEAEST